MKKITPFYSAIIGILFFGTAYAQTTQTITVRDRSTLQPIDNAVIEIYAIPTEGINPSKIWIAAGQTSVRGTASFIIPESCDSLRLRHASYAVETISKNNLQTANWNWFVSSRVILLNEVVFAANKEQEKKSDVPFSMSIIKAKEIQLSNPQTSADMLMNTGQVFVQKSQMGGGSPVLRGFEANKVLLVVDGVRMNNAIYRGGHTQDVITIDPNMLERAEVVFGPSSVIYGSDALGGTMHFITRKPVLSYDSSLYVTGNAFLRYASINNEQTGHLDINLGWRRFASLTSITRSEFGDLRMGATINPYYGDFGWNRNYIERVNGVDSIFVNKDPLLQRFTGYTQLDVMQKFMFMQNEKITHNLNIQISTSSNIPRYDRLQQLGGDSLLRFAEWDYGPQNRALVAYNLTLKGNNKLYDDAEIIASMQIIEQDRITRRRNSLNRKSQNEDVTVAALNADFHKTFLEKHELRYGLEFTHNIVKSTATNTDISNEAVTPSDTRYPGGDNSMTTAALYVSHSWEINKKLILSEGLRLSFVNLQAEWTDTTFFPFPYTEVTQSAVAPSGNIGIVWSPISTLRFNAIGSTGFRAPNLDDLSKVFESAAGTLIVPNPDLKPEYAFGGELGGSWEFTKGVQLELNGYYTALTNAIVVRPSTFSGSDSILYDGSLSQVVSSQNADRAYVTGFTGGLTGDLNDNFSFRGTVSYTYGRYKDTENDTLIPLDHIPPVFGQTALTYHTRKFECELFVRYNGWKRLKDYSPSGEDNLPQATVQGMPAWTTLNARAGYQINYWVRLTMAVENIMDINYRHFASGVSSPGRNFIISAKARF